MQFDSFKEQLHACREVKDGLAKFKLSDTYLNNI